MPQKLSFTVDQPALDQIILSKFEVPVGHKAIEFLPGLMTNLGSTESDLRECSLDVLWTWISRSTYNDGELLNIADPNGLKPDPGAWRKRNRQCLPARFFYLDPGGDP